MIIYLSTVPYIFSDTGYALTCETCANKNPESIKDQWEQELYASCMCELCGSEILQSK